MYVPVCAYVETYSLEIMAAIFLFLCCCCYSLSSPEKKKTEIKNMD